MYVSAISNRFSRGRSTPERRAMRAVLHFGARRSAASPTPVSGRATPPSASSPPARCRGPGLRPGVACGPVTGPPGGRRITSGWCRSALSLLVAQVLADHHDPTVTADHLALVTDLLDARLNLHVAFAVSSMCGLAVAEDDAATGQVIWAELHHHAVLGEDPDVVLAHLARDVREDLVTVRELDPKHRVRESLDDRALDLDDAVLLGHTLSIRCWATLRVSIRPWKSAPCCSRRVAPMRRAHT